MRNMIPSRSSHQCSNNVPHGRQPNRSFEAIPQSPDGIVPGVSDTSSGMCNEYTSTVDFSVPEQNAWNCYLSIEPNPNIVAEVDEEIPVPVPSEHDPSEHVVVKDGYTYYIRYLDESMSEEPPVQHNYEGEVLGEMEQLPSISKELSMLMVDSMLPEGAIPTLENIESSTRDWINYDELPLLSQQKQQQPVSTDHVSPPNDTSVENQCCKNYHTTLVKPRAESQQEVVGLSGCELFPVLSNALQQPSVEGFLPSNETVLMNSSKSSVVTMVPDFSHYCVECEKFFPSNDCLQEHMESNHRLFDEKLITMTSTPKASFNQAVGYRSGELIIPISPIVDSTNHRRKRPFFCDSCNISFDFVESYYMHNHSVHGGGVGTGYR
ncbi:uncharacterized protein LOC128715240 [Anopheles marshallii]|uniref:uncharacterized protein LOC128715240 n=1 Tax=Anopheles marshallii TaxID=1521116 RepID=UPI00237A0EB3|nr:uncharacterized protein LOC128715240 [Anopheles marshallii]